MNQTPERQLSIENMQDSLAEALEFCVKDNRTKDAVSILQEYLIDLDTLADPKDYLFLDNLTLLDEEV